MSGRLELSSDVAPRASSHLADLRACGLADWRTVGVYQVNAEVPLSVVPGDAVPVVLTQGGFRSNTATIAVR